MHKTFPSRYRQPQLFITVVSCQKATFLSTLRTFLLCGLGWVCYKSNFSHFFSVSLVIEPKVSFCLKEKFIMTLGMNGKFCTFCEGELLTLFFFYRRKFFLFLVSNLRAWGFLHIFGGSLWSLK